LHDGEDYELLFTMAAAHVRRIEPAVEVHVIGVVQPVAGIFIQRRDGTREPLVPRGWEHRL
jgi:thiamine monophosphate kinase